MSKLTKADVEKILSSLKRCDPEIQGGCDCCGTWVSMEEDSRWGEWVNRDELETVLMSLVKGEEE